MFALVPVIYLIKHWWWNKYFNSGLFFQKYCTLRSWSWVHIHKDFGNATGVWVCDWVSTPQEYGALLLTQRALCVRTLPLNQHVYQSLVAALFGLLCFCLFDFLSGSSLCSWPEWWPWTRKEWVTEAQWGMDRKTNTLYCETGLGWLGNCSTERADVF